MIAAIIGGLFNTYSDRILQHVQMMIFSTTKVFTQVFVY